MKKFIQSVYSAILSLFRRPKNNKENKEFFPPRIQEYLNECKISAFNAGIGGTAISNITSRFSAFIDKMLSEASSTFNNRIGTVEAEIKALSKKLSETFTERGQKMAAVLKPMLSKALSQINKTYGSMEEELKRLKNEVKDCYIRMHQFTEKKGYSPKFKTWWDTGKALIFTIAFTSSVETILNFFALEAHSAGISLFLMIFSLLISISIGFVCDHAGAAIAKRDWPHAIFTIAIGLVITGFIIWVRSTAPDTTEADAAMNAVENTSQGGIESLAAGFNFLNLAFYGLGLVIAMRVYRDREYWDAKDKADELSEKIEAKQAQMKGMPDELQNAKDEYRSTVIQHTNAEEEAIHSQYNALQIELAELTVKQEQLEKAYASYDTEGTSQIKEAYEEGHLHH